MVSKRSLTSQTLVGFVVKAVAEKKVTADSEHEQNLLNRIAGDPDDAAIIYTDLFPAQLSCRMESLGKKATCKIGRRWLR